MEEILIALGFVGLGGFMGAGMTIMSQLVAERLRGRGEPRPPVADNATDRLTTQSLERIGSALERLDRRMEALEERVEFSERLIADSRKAERHSLRGAPLSSD